MPRNNFGKYFLSGVRDTFNPTFQNVLDNLQQSDRQRAIMDEQNRRVAEQRRQEQQQNNFAFDLVSGQRPDPLSQITGQPKIPFTSGNVPLTTQDKINTLRSLDKTGRSAYDWYSQLFSPQTPTKAPTISAGGGLYGYKLNPLNNQLEVDIQNPIIAPPKKKLGENSGWGQNGEKLKIITYDDGSKKTISDGGFVRTVGSNGTTTKIFDLGTYKQTLNSAEGDYNSTKKKMETFDLVAGKDIFTKQEKELQKSINDEMSQNEQIFYSTMIPTARDYIDINYFNDIKSDPPEEEYTKRIEKAKDVTNMTLEDYKDKGLDAGGFKIDWSKYPKPKKIEQPEWERQIEAETYRSILQWIKLKFERL